jgi:hypothetical protein
LGKDSSSAMFRPGKILQFGGGSNGARVVDITSGTPVVTATQSLSSQRRRVMPQFSPTERCSRPAAANSKTKWLESTTAPRSGIPIRDSGRAAPMRFVRGYITPLRFYCRCQRTVAGGGHPGPRTMTT